MKKRTQIVKLKRAATPVGGRGKARLTPTVRIRKGRKEEHAAPVPPLVLEKIPPVAAERAEAVRQAAPVRQYADTENAFHLYLREIGETALLTS
jgi:hypothetical protein